MEVRKQGTRCAVRVESFQRDAQDIWGYQAGVAIHLGSYNTEEAAVQVLKQIFQHELTETSPFQMPQDFKRLGFLK